MNNKDLDDLKYLLEKYREEASMKYNFKLEMGISQVLFWVKEDLKK